MTRKTNSPDFKAMAELRYQIRRFLRFSESAARQAGIEPQQHQLLLAVRGLPENLKPTVGVLAERMQLQHHSTVELIDRLVDRDLLCRLRATDDRRQVLVKLTHEGEKFLKSSFAPPSAGTAIHRTQVRANPAGPYRQRREPIRVRGIGNNGAGNTPKTKKRRKDTHHG